MPLKNISPPPPADEPLTKEPPGSRSKIEAMRLRVADGRNPCRLDDAKGVGLAVGAAALLVALTCRVSVPAPALPLQAAQTASRAATATATAGRRIRTPVSRHLTRDGFYSDPPGRPVTLAVPSGSYRP